MELNIQEFKQKEFKYSITFTISTPESSEVGEYDETGFEIEPEEENIREILKMAHFTYGIYSPTSLGNWQSTSPVEDRNHFEKGEDKYFYLHIENVDGSDISIEEHDFITYLLSDGKFNSLEDDEFAKGGSVNTGLSWTLDRARHNKSEDYEVPINKRKFEEGGGVKSKKDDNYWYIHNLILKNKRILDEQNLSTEKSEEVSKEIQRLENLIKEKYEGGGEVQFRELSNSKNFDVITPNGRFEIEVDKNDGSPKYAIKHGDDKRMSWKREELKDYESEIFNYAMRSSYAKGGVLKSFLNDSFEEGGDIDSMKKYDAIVHFRSQDGEQMQKEYKNIHAFDKEDAENKAKIVFNQEDSERFNSREIEWIDTWEKGEAFSNGGEADERKNMLGRVVVKFNDPKHNYATSVSGSITEAEARKYFVGKQFNVGVYPNEDWQKVIDIEFYPKGTYSDGGEVGDVNSVSELYDDEVASEYPYARDMVAYFIFGDREDNKIADAIKGKYSNETADESALSEIMLQHEYNWRYTMPEIEEETIAELGDLMDYYSKGGDIDDDKKIRFDIYFYMKSGDRDTYQEDTFRGKNLNDAIEYTLKILEDKKINYAEIYHRDFYVGSINLSNSKEFIKGNGYYDFMKYNNFEFEEIISDWKQEALEDLRSETGLEDLEIEESEEENNFTASNEDAEFLVCESEDVAKEIAIKRVKSDLEENPTYFQRDWLMTHVNVNDYFEEVFKNWNMGYATEIMTEDDEKYGNRLISEMIDWGIMSKEEGLSDDAETIMNDRLDNFVQLITINQLSNDKGLKYYMDNFGDEETFNVLVENSLIDFDEASKDAIEIDGIAHFLSSYDGETVYLENGSVAFRNN